jgi:acetylornithine/N-succinyldiaminopimelate aminotransferase
MIGIKTRVPNTDFVAAARAEKLLTIPAGDNVVRLLPPLIVSDEEVSEAVARLSRACSELEQAIPQLGAAE